MRPCLYASTSLLYTPIGEDPVGSPRISIQTAVRTQNERLLLSGIELVNSVDYVVRNVFAEEVIVLLNYQTHDFSCRYY